MYHKSFPVLICILFWCAFLAFCLHGCKDAPKPVPVKLPGTLVWQLQLRCYPYPSPLQQSQLKYGEVDGVPSVIYYARCHQS